MRQWLRRALGGRDRSDEAEREDKVRRLEERTDRAIDQAEREVNTEVRQAYEAILQGHLRTQRRLRS